MCSSFELPARTLLIPASLSLATGSLCFLPPVPLLLLPPGTPRPLGWHNTAAYLSLQVSSPRSCLGSRCPMSLRLTVALAVSAALGFPDSLPELRARTGAAAALGPSRRGGRGEAGPAGTGQGGAAANFTLGPQPGTSPPRLLP